jgi:PPOX class probable F420-dependent enzyme
MVFPEEFRDLLSDDSKALLYLATLMQDGSPQVTPVWFDTEGELIRVNTNEGRVKDRNMKRRPRVAMSIQDPKDTRRSGFPYQRGGGRAHQPAVPEVPRAALGIPARSETHYFQDKALAF